MNRLSYLSFPSIALWFLSWSYPAVAVSWLALWGPKKVYKHDWRQQPRLWLSDRGVLDAALRHRGINSESSFLMMSLYAGHCTCILCLRPFFLHGHPFFPFFFFVSLLFRALCHPLRHEPLFIFLLSIKKNNSPLFLCAFVPLPSTYLLSSLRLT